MHSERYQVREPTLGILSTGDVRVPVMLPVNSVIVLIDGPLAGDRLVEVLWEGKPLMMFTQDMRSRCDLLESAAGGT